MAGNFEFLKKTDKELFEIIEEAEHLYRDEYFDQCMAQTRRFGENVCKKVLADKRTTEDTFDEMLATLKDSSSGEEQEKEFIDDLYFLKKHGNDAVHSSKIERTGTDALECLQRAFEAAINYAVYNCNGDENILKLRFDTELLITGKKSTKTLAQKYEEEKAKELKQEKEPKKKKSTKGTGTGKKRGRKPKKQISLFPVGWNFGKKAPVEEKKEPKKKFVKQSYTMAPSKKKNGISIFWIIVGVSSFISLITILILFVATVL